MEQETIIIQIKRHFSLKIVSLACLTLCYPTAFAIGFGEVVLRSNLGEPLRIQVPLNGAAEDILVASCFKPRIDTLNGELLDVPHLEFVLPSRPNQPVYINLVSKTVMVEPAVKFSIVMTCGQTIQRTYPLLLDIAGSPNAVQSVPQADVMSTPDTQVSVLETSSPAAQSSAPVKKSHAAKTQNNQGSQGSVGRSQDAASPTPEKPPVQHASHPKLPKHAAAPAPGKDVLRVSNDDIDTDTGLKMTQTLTDRASTTPLTADQQSIAENKIAQAQFAAILRGEDPLVAAQNEIKQQQLKAKALQDELNKVKQLDAVKAQADKEFSPLLIGLISTVAALCLALIGLVAIAIHKSRKTKENTWWDPSNEQKKNVVDIVDYLQTTADEGNLDPNPITTTREPPNTEHGEKTETATPAVNKEEPGPKFKRMGLPALEDTNSSTFNFFGNRGQSIHIEEISDITQEAEFWMSVNDPHRAIEILEPQGSDENQTTPVTWLYLLDLYRLVGDEDNYRDLRHRFKLKFNAKIPNFNEEIVAGSARDIEDFPHLTSNCCALWNSDDISAYLESLLVDDREGERVGFDLPVYRDILFLLTIANELKRHKYSPMPKEPKPLETNEPPAATFIIEPEKLAVKPSEPEPTEYTNSLNFDLLDFKVDDKNKG